MTLSKQPGEMRGKHLVATLTSLEAAKKDLGDARDWCFDLDHFPEREAVLKAKDAVERAITLVARVLDREFPDA